MGNAIDNTDSIIDSRDVIERIAELSDIRFSELDENEKSELHALQELARQGADDASDWHYVATFIHADYFTEYTKELLNDIGYLPADMPDWIVIDWRKTADNIKADYTEVDFDGETYYVR